MSQELPANPATRCSKCFQAKGNLEPLFGVLDVMICTSCKYKVNDITGFLEYVGMGFTIPLPAPDTREKESSNGSSDPASTEKPEKKAAKV